jgi:hypothetical protein
MPQNRSRAGKEVERLRISDEPHSRYSNCHPITGKELKRGIPILTKATGGSIVSKDVTYYTVECPECEIPARYTNDSEPVCPQCGIICSGKDTILNEQIINDAKAAGRVGGSEDKS